MAISEVTSEEESMLEQIVQVHLSERRYEVEDFEVTFSRESSPNTLVASDRLDVRKRPSQ